MARGAAHVPKFGDWGNDQAVPFTMCFEKAREVKNTGAKIINPNDPQENPELFPPRPDQEARQVAPVRKTPEPKKHNYHRDAQKNPELFPSRPDQEPRRPAAVRQTAEPKNLNNDVDNNVNKRFFESPARNVDNRRPGQQVLPSRFDHNRSNSGDHNRSNSGSEHRSSPLHKDGIKSTHPFGRGNAIAPAGWEAGKNSSYRDTDNASTKSRMGQGSRKQVDNNIYQQRSGGAVVPKFGDWETKNLPSGENFTQIFNKVREDKKNPTPDRLLNIAQKQPEAGYGTTPSTQAYNKNEKQKKCGCFGRY